MNRLLCLLLLCFSFVLGCSNEPGKVGAQEVKVAGFAASDLTVPSDLDGGIRLLTATNTGAKYGTNVPIIFVRAEAGIGTVAAFGDAGRLVPFSGPFGGVAATPFQFSASAPIALGATGSTVMSAAQALTPVLTITSTSQSGDVTLDFGTNAVNGTYLVDANGLVLNAHNVVFKNGTTSKTLSAVPTGGLIVVVTHGTNLIAVN